MESIDTAVLVQRVLQFEEQVSRKLDEMAPKKADRFWDVVAKLSIVAITALFAFGYRLDGRVSYIENTRFTANDFQQRMLELDRRITQAAAPPEWLRAELVSVSLKLDGLKEQSAKLSERIVRLESKLETTPR